MKERIKNICEKREIKDFIFVSVSEQKLYLVKGGEIIKEYPVSTSRYGTGNEEGSFKTPTGLHRIYKKIGKDMPLDCVFVGRVPEGKIEDYEKKDDLITGRILWLEGVEEGVNRGEGVDTRNRYIYIHGTPEDSFEGKPSSRGCVRMRNRDVGELFEYVDEGTFVIIDE